jgi:methylated-DNA-protein-cysteine methyltransferase-like protein
MSNLSETIIAIIREIPVGKVLTYGEIAFRAGSPKSARLVSNLLHSCSDKYSLPWHRVINSQGKISLTGIAGEEQKQRLLSEGIRIIKGKIDLAKYLYQE